MSRGWNWDFEDERRPRRTAEPDTPAPARAPGASPDDATQARRTQIRRRRGGAAVVAVALLALVVAALSGAHHSNSTSATSATKGRRVLVKHATGDPEVDADTAVRSVLAYTPFIKVGSARTRDIALTFDDGPGPYTPGVLSVLEHYKVRATFFEIGKMLRYFSSSTLREIEDGDVIGDHTESHPMMAQLSRHDQHEELFEQLARIELLGGRRPVLFRPPYGSFNATTLAELHQLHLLMVLWSVDTEDYRQPGVSVIVERALAGAQPGAIILMHDAGGVREQTIAALPIIIDKLRAKGFRLVTVPQLLMDDPPPAGQQIPPNLAGG